MVKLSPSPTLPNELIEEVLKRLPRSRLSKAIRVSKQWHNSAIKLLYNNVIFKSVVQRELFFESLQTFNDPSLKKSKVTSPEGQLLKRRSSLRSRMISTQALMIKSIDFGLRPRHLSIHEPDLPCSQRIPQQVDLSDETQQSKRKSRSSRLLSRMESPVLNKSNSNLCIEVGPINREAIHSPRRIARSVSPKKSTRGTGILIDTKNLFELSSSNLSPLSIGESQKRNFSRQVKSPSDMLIDSPTSLKTRFDSKDSRFEVKMEERESYGAWSDRFVSPLIPLISQYIPHLKELSLCGCQIDHPEFSMMLESLPSLENLDISYSTLRSNSLESISRFCRHKLQFLNVSGIFKLGRNKPFCIISISMFCESLKVIVAKDCPEIYRSILNECLNACGNRIRFDIDTIISDED